MLRSPEPTNTYSYRQTYPRLLHRRILAAHATIGTDSGKKCNRTLGQGDSKVGQSCVGTNMFCSTWDLGSIFRFQLVWETKVKMFAINIILNSLTVLIGS